METPGRAAVAGGWAACLPRTEAATAGFLRACPGLRGCLDGDWLWLRGPELTDALGLALRRLPGAQRFMVLPDDRLRQLGKRVPHGRLPAGSWQPLPELLAWSGPPIVGPGTVGERQPVRLRRGGSPHEAELLLLAAAAWRRYVEAAPEVRLRPLRWALSEDGRVLVRGRPLPPVRGTRYALHAAMVAVPCGYTWDPPVPAEVLVTLLALSTGDVALWQVDGGYERLPAAVWVAATRSSVRLSGAGEWNGGWPPGFGE